LASQKIQLFHVLTWIKVKIGTIQPDLPLVHAHLSWNVCLSRSANKLLPDPRIAVLGRLGLFSCYAMYVCTYLILLSAWAAGKTFSVWHPCLNDADAQDIVYSAALVTMHQVHLIVTLKTLRAVSTNLHERHERPDDWLSLR
jgi:hypothetical protein